MPKNRKDEKLESSRVEVSLELLLKGAKKGYTIDELVEDLSVYTAISNLSALLAAGANPDKLVSRLISEEVAYCLDELLAAGAKIDVDELVSQLGWQSIHDNLDRLLAGGANPDQLVSQLTPWSIIESLEELLAFHAWIDVDKLVSRLDSAKVADNLDKLLDAGANPDKLVSRLLSNDVVRCLDKLLAAGAKIHVDELVSWLEPWEIACYQDRLLAAGVDPELLRSLSTVNGRL